MGEQYGWVSEETQHERARGALARTSDVLTTGGHYAVDRAHVRPTILQQCSSLPYRRRRTWPQTRKNIDLSNGLRDDCVPPDQGAQ